jgi:hypothetical protein
VFLNRIDDGQNSANITFAQAERLEVCPGVLAPVVTLEMLLKMKREAGRIHALPLKQAGVSFGVPRKEPV